MKNIVLILIGFFVIESCTLAQKKLCLNTQDIESFVETQLEEDNVINKGLLIDSVFLDYHFQEIDSININLDTVFFTIKDIEYFNCQIDALKKYKNWDDLLEDKSRIIATKVVEAEIIDNGWEEYRTKYGEGVYYYSIPLFSKNRDKAFLFKKYLCGPYCGYHIKEMLFERKGSEWIKSWERIKGKK